MKIMRILMAIVAIIVVIICVPLSAQTTPPASWPVCQLGKAPVAPGPAPVEATTFPVKGGPVVMSEAGLNGAVKLIRCNLPTNTPSYRGADGVLRDVASNQPYWPVGWDAAPAPIPEAPAPAMPQTPAPPTSVTSSSSSVVNLYLQPIEPVQSGPVTNNYGPYKTGHSCGRGCKVLIGTTVGVGAVVAIIFATHGHNNNSSGGYIGTGGAQ
jgi:hypothetical protein